MMADRSSRLLALTGWSPLQRSMLVVQPIDARPRRSGYL